MVYIIYVVNSSLMNIMLLSFDNLFVYISIMLLILVSDEAFNLLLIYMFLHLVFIYLSIFLFYFSLFFRFV